MILWNRDTKDYESGSNPVKTFNEWIRKEGEGPVSLQHDLNGITSSFVAETLDVLGQRSVFKNRDLTVVDGIVNFMYNTLKENNILK